MFILILTSWILAAGTLLYSHLQRSKHIQAKMAAEPETFAFQAGKQFDIMRFPPCHGAAAGITRIGLRNGSHASTST